MRRTRLDNQDEASGLAADLWVPMGLVQIASIEPWEVLHGEPANQ